MTNPVQENAVDGSLAGFLFHPPAKSASTKHCSPLSLFGLKVIPFLSVALIYLTRCLTACSCDNFGLLQKQAH